MSVLQSPQADQMLLEMGMSALARSIPEQSQSSQEPPVNIYLSREKPDEVQVNIRNIKKLSGF